MLILSKILSMQNNKHKGDRIVNTDRHKNIQTRVATTTDSINDWAKNMEFTKLLPRTMLYY